VAPENAPQQPLAERWQRAVAAAEAQLPEGGAAESLSGLECISCDSGRLVVRANDDASRDAAEGRCGELLAWAMSDRDDRPLRLEIVAAPGPIAPARPGLNERYTFANFVIGPSNRLAHAAALAVSDAPGEAYNPFFVHAGVGLGKTHLLQAVCHRLLERDPNLYVLYASCDEFQSRYFSAIEAGRLDEFRDWTRRADVLAVDDIHFLSQRERTQEEFFHFFNSLYNAHRQIILSSDSAPAEVPSIEERLVSRFRWGLVAEIEPPTFETTLEIVRRKARERGHELPDDVVQMVASSESANIRETEGAVIKLLGYAALMGAEIDAAVAAEVLGSGDSRVRRDRLVSLDEVQRAVADFFEFSVADLQSKSRARSLARARHVAMYLVRELTGASLKETGGHFGGRDHSSVKYACDKVASQVARGGSPAAVVDELKRAIVARAGRRGDRGSL